MMPAEKEPSAVTAGFSELKRRVWVTRQDVYVDRIASAWLIRRFIDPDARFKFVRGKGYVPEPDELRFDMFEAEFTHEGDRCSFEVLLSRAGLADPALVAIGEIVHDIDLKDSKFGREETSGIAHLVAGLSITHKGDEQRIERGAAVFDDLYRVLPQEARLSGPTHWKGYHHQNAASAGVLVTVPVMEIGIVRVPMHERLMPVPMSVRFAYRGVRPMCVLMVFVMRMPVLVLHRLVHMLMLVAFRQVQP